ncbi:YdeI/OmpD-associated family protein [Ulvibacter litoralis]|uniref:Uncharacterized conserved protein YdeI, YjbR/CyaY-like superfamily, DUF1801 family n=1 Tax=Ulvibacter litoralis TaxID=227084 RepID=A0A1G7F0Q5_9FLAO|nr:DUF1801 domain-containing protein [Ulvibacter litoralis]GHC53291.1 hypothetical protein GCM10008083_16600 [Ulvibacter litoralis]SDE69145.1 Uncharacterized conserved protein YdeI, YjbR/CyaY-like superfamily, DUF1801 family [Ulvibacter litoralis]
MTDAQKVTAYIEKHSKWSEKLTELRAIFNETDLQEEVKWGAPSYTFDGKIVAGIAAFKHHYAIWFHQGVFLKDPAKKLVNAQEGTTKALRQWRFTENDPIETAIVKEYIIEAIANSIAGKVVKVQRKQGVVLPSLLKEAFATDVKVKEAFKKLTAGKQREYAAYIEAAKREETKQKRLEKIIPMIRNGQGLHDKYKNC